MITEYSQDFLVSANEANAEGELAITVLVTNLIEVATRAAIELGIGNPTMAHLNAGWVLSRLSIEVSEYPKVNTQYRLITWVESWNRHFSVRDFEIQDLEGNTFGYARSVWMVLNTVTHENFGLSHLTLPDNAIPNRPCPIPRQDKHIEIKSYSDSKVLNVLGGEIVNLDNPASTPGKASFLTANVEDRIYTFKYNDIDFYRHVNTVRYVSLLLNSYTLEEFDKNFLSRLELSFLHEGNFGETVEIRRFNHPLASNPTDSNPTDSNPNRREAVSDCGYAASLSSFSLFSRTKDMPILFARIRLSKR